MPGASDRARPRYFGCIIPGPLREAYSYPQKPRSMDELRQLSRAQQLEVTRTDAETLVRKINAYASQGRAVPLTTEHLQSGADPLPTGSVTRAWIDPRSGGVFAEFEFDLSTDGGSRQAHALLANKFFTGLSLRHDLRDVEPQELSLCLKGARDGTGVLGELNPHATGVLGELNRDAYKPDQNPSVSIAASSSFTSSSTMSMPAPPQAAGAPGSAAAAAPGTVSQAGTGTAAPTAVAESHAATTASKPASNDPVMRLMEKIASPNAILSKDERMQVLNMFAQNIDAFEKVKKQHENKLVHFMEALKVLAQSALPKEEADRFSSALQNQTGKALQENDMDTVINTVQPLIVAASERLSQAPTAIASPPVLYTPEALNTTSNTATEAPSVAASTSNASASLSSVILHTKVDPDMLPILNYLSQRRSTTPAPATMVQAPQQPMGLFASPANYVYSPPTAAYRAPVVYASSNAPAESGSMELSAPTTGSSWMRYFDPNLRSEFGAKTFNGMEFNAYKHYSRDLIEGLASESESDRLKRQRIGDSR